ncbi:Thermostable hemolysin [Vibrio aerogenes CECT 7868]|uniref:Thermostable hemolysin n=1 Tax=Vibrio aerogenes CECT 7868 TaxID=1216006 RepID=A0A1M5ZK88_9VIBR|nr:thermostable hemolysin [Vibrio aerogenes]SHI24568.1 Thermostable hemolysin [Vibrio aerogenes CECT 7868]
MKNFILKDHRLNNINIRIVRAGDSSAKKAKDYISDIYLKNYQAKIKPKPDIIVSSFGISNENILASAGISFGSDDKPFFSERYLEDSLTDKIRMATSQTIARNQIVEIGSLASDKPSAAADLINLLPLITWLMGNKAILCTTTRNLRKLFNHYDIPYVYLCDASPQKLSQHEREIWGTYYDQSPETVIILLKQCGNLFEKYCGKFMVPELMHIHQANLSETQVAI